MKGGVNMSAIIKITSIKNDPAGKDTQSKLNDEWVRIENIGDQPENLSNWILTDWRPSQQHIHKYTIPMVLSNLNTWTLDPGELLFFMTGTGSNKFYAKTDKYPAQFHLFQNSSKFIWNNTGDTACLYNSSGNLVSQLTV